MRHAQAGPPPDIHESFQGQAFVDAVFQGHGIVDAVNYRYFVWDGPAFWSHHGFERVHQRPFRRVEQGADIHDVGLIGVIARFFELGEAGGFGVEDANQVGHWFSPGEKKAPVGAVWC